MSETVSASNGKQLPLSSLEQTFAYDGDFVLTISVHYDGIDYVQSFSNDGTNITDISAWIAQS